jgi:hypothetical protein
MVQEYESYITVDGMLPVHMVRLTKHPHNPPAMYVANKMPLPHRRSFVVEGCVEKDQDRTARP